MGELYVVSVNLLVPSGERLVQVTPDWGVEVDGKHQTGYLPEEALVFSALCAKKDEVLPLEVAPKLVLDVHNDAVSNGATPLSVIDKGLDQETEEGIRRARIIRITDRLLKARLGPLASNIYKLRLTKPISYFLCTDITDEKIGLDIIESSASYLKIEHIRRFRAQRTNHLLDEKRWENAAHRLAYTQQPRSSKPTESFRQFLVNKPTSVPPKTANLTLNLTGLAPDRARLSNLDVSSLVKDQIMSILEAEAGCTVSSRQISDKFSALGFSRLQIQQLLDRIDVFIAPGYLVKSADRKEMGHIMYRRTDVKLRKK